jgi:hypothetical protein
VVRLSRPTGAREQAGSREDQDGGATRFAISPVRITHVWNFVQFLQPGKGKHLEPLRCDPHTRPQ